MSATPGDRERIAPTREQVEAAYNIGYGYRNMNNIIRDQWLADVLAERERVARAALLSDVLIAVHSTVDIEVSDYNTLVERLESLAAAPEAQPEPAEGPHRQPSECPSWYDGCNCGTPDPPASEPDGGKL